MIQQLQKRRVGAKRSRGFTIIEVMIVLAIAGLIMLIVFLAVPALQRSSRNTQRKADASNALAAVSEYTNNNGGSLPGVGALSFTAPNLTIGAAGTAQSSAKLGYYTSGVGAGAGQVNLTGYAALPSTVTDTLLLETGTTCTSATTTAAGTARAIVAIFGIETSSGLTWECQGS